MALGAWLKFAANAAPKLLKGTGSALATFGRGTVTAAKTVVPVVKGTWGVTKTVGKAALKHPVAVGAGWLYMTKEDGEGILSATAKELLGEDAVDEGGAIKGVKQTVFGKDNDDKSIVENTTDSLLGDGTYQDAKQNVRKVVDYVKESVTPNQQSVQEPGAQMLPGQLLYDANGNVVGAYPGAGNPQQLNNMQSANPFASMNNFVNQMSGGKVTGLNVIEIIAAAYMMFGRRFGWLGKIAGALVGGVAANDITNRAATIQHQQAMPGVYNMGITVPQPTLPQPPEEPLNEHTIERGRRR